MPLPAEFLDRLKAANPIAEVMGSYVSLKRTGRDYICLCPFHNEKNPVLSRSSRQRILSLLRLRSRRGRYNLYNEI